MAPRGHRGADPQALRGLPAARRADLDLRQQARPRGPRPVRPVGRDRAVSGTRRDAGLLADRHGRDFLGTYALLSDALLLFERGAGARIGWLSATPAEAGALRSLGGTPGSPSASRPLSFL